MNGLLNVYKPSDMTSFTCVNLVKKITGSTKAGHAGTLDPQATGVLPVALDKYTKAVEFFMDFDKSYRAKIYFGKSTDTCDIWGQTVGESSDLSGVTAQSVAKVLEHFTGKIQQVPPAYSAIKINGVPAYKLARKGLDVPVKTREINVYSIKLLDFTEHEDCKVAEIDVDCSKGTYIRSLCRDIGLELSVNSCMSALERTRYGIFESCKAVTLEELRSMGAEKHLQPLEVILTGLNSVTLSKKEEKDYYNGLRVAYKPLEEQGDISDKCKVYSSEGVLIAIASIKEDRFGKALKAYKNFKE